MIDINKEPTERDLRWFGVIGGLFFGLLGTLAFFKLEWHLPAYALWTLGAAFVLVYYSAPSWKRPLYRGWMYAVFPIGWVLSHILLAIVYYLVLTPTALVLRLFGKDLIQRRRDPGSKSYWIEYDPSKRPDRYFRQF